jgi:hypothetical protein
MGFKSLGLARDLEAVIASECAKTKLYVNFEPQSSSYHLHSESPSIFVREMWP